MTADFRSFYFEGLGEACSPVLTEGSLLESVGQRASKVPQTHTQSVIHTYVKLIKNKHISIKRQLTPPPEATPQGVVPSVTSDLSSPSPLLTEVLAASSPLIGPRCRPASSQSLPPPPRSALTALVVPPTSCWFSCQTFKRRNVLQVERSRPGEQEAGRNMLQWRRSYRLTRLLPLLGGDIEPGGGEGAQGWLRPPQLESTNVLQSGRCFPWWLEV